MHWLELLGGIVVIWGIGCVFHINASMEARRKYAFAMEYRTHFIAYANTVSQKDLIWLNTNSNRMQNDSGSMGILAYYVPAGEHERISNYPVFLNMIGNIEQYRMLDHGIGIFQDTINTCIRYVDETLLRYIGFLEEVISEHSWYLKNPVSAFGAGVRFIVRLPISILYWTDLISYTRYSAILKNPLVKFIGFCMSVFGLFSGVVTVVTGWSQFIQDVHKM